MATLYRKYRPTVWSAVVGQEHVKTTLAYEIASGQFVHAYLFCGPRGVGKTTAARIFARGVNCTGRAEGSGEPCGECAACASILEGRAMDIVEIDAASHRGIEMVRETIIDGSRFAPSALKYKVFIIDEVHMLSNDAWNALLKTLEEPPGHALFVLATTELHKVPATVVSRCERFEFRRIADDAVRACLVAIAAREGKEVAPEVLDAVVRLAEGGLRDAESLLGQLFGTAGDAKVVDLAMAESVLPIAGAAQARELADAMVGGDVSRGFAAVAACRASGVDALRVMDEVMGVLRERMVRGGAAEVGGFACAVSRLVAARQSARFLTNAYLALEVAVAEACAVPAGVVAGTGAGSTRDAVRAASGALTDGRPGHSDAVAPETVLPSVASRLTNTASSSSDPIPAVPEPVPTTFVAPEPVVVPVQPVVSVPVQVAAPAVAPPPPAPPRAQAPADGSPVIALTTVAAKWQQFIEKVGAVQPSLSYILSVAKPVDVKGAIVQIGFGYPFHRSKCNEDKNLLVLEGIISALLGVQLRVEGVLLDKKDVIGHTQSTEGFGGQNSGFPAAPAVASDASAADALANAFGGKIVG